MQAVFKNLLKELQVRLTIQGNNYEVHVYNM